MQTIELSLSEHTHLMIAEKWMENVCRTFYENCFLSSDGDELLPSISAEIDIARLIKFYNPEVYNAVLMAKKEEKERNHD